jgi:hypothetical protein
MEHWKTIPAFPAYVVSDMGRVRRCVASNASRVGRVLRPHADKHGYAGVWLHLNGQPHYRLVSRLVAQAFIPNPDNKPTVNHVDGVKSNNGVGNLEWATCVEQIQHGLAHGLIERSPITGHFA